MDYKILGFNESMGIEDIYPRGLPAHAKQFRLNGEDAYTIFNRINWNKEEFQFLKTYAYYHMSAPCYGQYGKGVAKKIIEVRVTDALRYLVIKAFMDKKIDIF